MINYELIVKSEKEKVKEFIRGVTPKFLFRTM